MTYVSTSDFQSEVGEVFGKIGGELPPKFGRRFSSFFCWGKSSEAFSTKTPPRISPSNFTTRFWVVAGPTNLAFLAHNGHQSLCLSAPRWSRNANRGSGWLWGGQQTHWSVPRRGSLVAPYCAIPRDYLSDTPLFQFLYLFFNLFFTSLNPPPPSAGNLEPRFGNHSLQTLGSGVQGPPQFLKKRSENAGANETLSGGFAAIPGIAPRVAPRIVGFVLLKSWEAIPRMEFRIPRMEFPIPRGAPRIPRPRAPRMAFSLRERFSGNWGGPQASEKRIESQMKMHPEQNWSLEIQKGAWYV